MMFLALLAIATIVEGTPDDICGQTFTVLSGQTQTVDYLFADGNYPGNSNCVFHLKATGSNGMRIRFTELDIEKHARCSFDYLQIFDGSTTSSSSLGKLCGYVVPDPVESNSNFVTLKFVSDRTVHKSGFILQFSTKTEEQFVGSCSPTLTTQTGTLSSPYFPNNYPNRVNCTYEIAPATGNQILIQFPTFQLERSTGCVMDYVTISSRTQPISGKICGDLDGYGYLVPGSHAVLNFVSDRSSTRRGFQVSYKVVDPHPAVSNFHAKDECVRAVCHMLQAYAMASAVQNGDRPSVVLNERAPSDTCKELDNICLDGCTVNEDNFLQCTCKPGFGNKKGETQCHDVDECRISNGGCADQCTNTEGSFQCACTRSGFFLSPDGFNCTDRSCSVDNAGCEHNCHVSGTGGYFCTCNPGYLVTGNGHECTDIDECTNPKYQHACEQKCNNEPGSYFCDCQSGYQLSANRRTCNDVDECLTQGDNCEHECHNYPGGWSCSCYPGYQANPSYTYGCIDINECLPEHIPDHCDECLNFQGGFSCTTCSPGFVANENQTLCLDTNECADNNGGCQQMCINSPGSYSCQCHSGQELVDGSTNGECKDINECAPNNGRGPCEHYCENSVGAFQCHCLDGFSMQPGSGTVCQDIDECSTENGGCQQQCNNAQGAFSCSCFTGYYMIEGSCTDIDECLEYKPCDLALGAKCVNTPGSFQCICPKGYDVVNNTKCLDVDECANGTYGTSHGCPQQCVNTPGSYHCKCHPGFVDVGNNSCVDLNECSNSPCQHKDLCTNTVGSFQCACPPGYYLLGDGISCSDVDECAGDEIRCEQICINEIGDYKCACNDGFELNRDNYTCADINECLRNTSGCSDGCVNTRGGYRCYCHQGYGFSAANNQTCYDTDECTVNNGGCDHVCTNNPGSFSCGCQDGYRVAGNRCHDIDECSMNNGNCSQKCNNLNGTYACECAPDFKLGDDSRTCGHCPTCEAFEQVVSDVATMKPNTAIVQQLTTANMQLSAKIALLESRLEQLQNRINTIEQSQGR